MDKKHPHKHFFISKSKLLYCCSLIVMIILLKLTVLEDENIWSGALTLNFQDDLNGTGNEERRNINNLNITLELGENSSTETWFPYDETCFFKHYPLFKVPKYTDKEFAVLRSNKGLNYKTILVYHYAYGNNFGFGFGYKLFEASCCKETRCFITDQRNKIPIDEFDAVMIHFRDFSHRNLPTKRKKDQRWVFYEREPPTLSSKNPEKYAAIFNWTMTYRSDSDIVARYGRIYPKSMFSNKDFSKFPRETTELQSLVKGKPKMAAWMVSHCDTDSKREDYVRKLQKYIDVDIYGKCGPLKCDRKKNSNCLEMIEKNYKFYLSFENSFCTDYVTEKFFSILYYNVIPVVLGSADYASLGPPHSYIDTRDFKSQKELAEYLEYLAANDTAYMEYFKWREDYISIAMSWIKTAGSFCDLCYKLHNDPEEKIYYDLKDWFHGKSKCMK